MKIVVGLGNPGSRYAGTRHNVGFAVVDLLAESPRAGQFQSRFQAQVVEWLEELHKVLLVICDDINLPLGKLRARARGTHGGHNGLRDIQNHLGTTEYPRLRIGVGSPDEDAVDHVLSRFRPTERPIIDEAVQVAAQAVGVWIHEGIEACMNRYNA